MGYSLLRAHVLRTLLGSLCLLACSSRSRSQGPVKLDRSAPVSDDPDPVIGEETRAALELTPHHYDFLNLYSMLIAARTYAWAGAGDAAVDLLETLAAGSTTLGPAEISRDPFFTIPLADNPRYRKLANELEKQLERNQALF